jgi:hypothetical protein
MAVSLVVLAVAMALAAGCGGGGSVSGPSGASGGDGSAVVQGQVMGSRTAQGGETGLVLALWTGLGVSVAEAQAGTPVVGATVRLLQGGTVIATTTTDANGQFVFRGVTPGTYTVQVQFNNQVVTQTVVVGAGDQAIVGVATNGATSVQVTAISTDVFGNDAQLGHALNIANASASCDLVRVTQLRGSGLGWGEIAHRCNVSPGVIGLGRSNLSDQALDDARERTGHGRQHGGGAAGGGNNKDPKDKDKGKNKS